MTETLVSGDNINFKESGVTISKITVSVSDTITLSGTGDTGTSTLSGLSEPISDNDASNKLYVSKKTWKNPVLQASIGLLVLGSLGDSSQIASSIVDVTPTFTISDIGSRILVKNQNGTTVDIENGIYELTLCTNVSFFYWVRASDAQSGFTASGSVIVVSEGSTIVDTMWFCNTNTNYGSALTFIEFVLSGATTPGLPLNSFQFNRSNNFSGFNDGTSTTVTDLEYIQGATSIINVGNGFASSDVNIGRFTHTGPINIMTGSTNTGVVNIGSSNGIIKIGNSDITSYIILERTSTYTVVGNNAMINYDSVISGGSNPPTFSGGVVTITENGQYLISFNVTNNNTINNAIAGWPSINNNASGTDNKLYYIAQPPSTRGGPSLGTCGILSLSSADTVRFKFGALQDNSRTICSSNAPGTFSIVKIMGS
jgi:hypothetical protein